MCGLYLSGLHYSFHITPLQMTHCHDRKVYAIKCDQYNQLTAFTYIDKPNLSAGSDRVIYIHDFMIS